MKPSFPCKARTPVALTALMIWVHALPAAAHHPMGGVTPGNFVEGLLSGLGHPIIGFDHLLFVFAIGMACFYFGQRLFATVAFLGGAITGTVVHLQNATLPFADAWVAMSLIVLGILLLRKQEFLKRKAALVLFALCGIVHGYAYGEAVIGAEPTPLFAYLAGFTLVQLAITFCGYLAARYLSRAQPAFHTLKATGGSLALVGAGFLAVSLITQG